MPKKKTAVKKKIVKTVKTAKKAKTAKQAAPSKPQTAKKSAVQKKAQKTAVTKKTMKVAKDNKKEPMSQREELIQKIKHDLIAQKESLLKEAEETLSSLPSELNFPDIGDQATAETDRNFMLRLRDRERMLLKKIEETIDRIDSKNYGMCNECENEIGIKRLQARPVTTLCIDCKTRQEEEERITESGQ